MPTLRALLLILKASERIAALPAKLAGMKNVNPEYPIEKKRCKNGDPRSSHNCDHH